MLDSEDKRLMQNSSDVKSRKTEDLRKTRLLIKSDDDDIKTLKQSK